MRLARLNIGTRLISAFALLLVMTAAIAIFAIFNLSRVERIAQGIAEDRLPSVAANGSVDGDLQLLRQLELRHTLENGDSEIAALEKKMSEARARIETSLETLKAHADSPELRATLGDFMEHYRQYLHVHDGALELSRSKKRTEAQQALVDSQSLFDETDGALDTIDSRQTQLSAVEIAASERAYTNARGLLIGVTFAAIVLGIVFAILTTRSIVVPVRRAAQVAEGIAAGRLGQDIVIDSADEAGRMLEALRAMDHRLGAIVQSIGNSAEQVSSAASQISHGNDDLSARTQEQAAALEQTSASMEEMTETVRQNSDNARKAQQLASGAHDHATRGGEVVDKTVSAMGEINASSRKIADIISVIDAIAFQTNLLALNAAVEAARAGEQGRGFAVVANEVRGLAQRSATAAKEIKTLIEESVHRVQTGSELVNSSGRALAEILESVKRVNDVVAEIAAASEEQAGGIDQVRNTITQMDATTQQNAALVEEAAAASKSMEQQAQELLVHVGFFKDSRAVQTPSNVVPLTRRMPTPPAPRHAPLAKTGNDTWQDF